MEYRDYFDFPATNAVDHNVGSSDDDQFSGSVDATSSTDLWIVDKFFGVLDNLPGHAVRSGRPVARDIVGDFLKVPRSGP